MISVKMPKTAILLKKPKRLHEDQFVFTYEYGWSEFGVVGSLREYKSRRVVGADLCMPTRCSWRDVVIGFSFAVQAGVTG